MVEVLEALAVGGVETCSPILTGGSRVTHSISVDLPKPSKRAKGEGRRHYMKQTRFFFSGAELVT